MFLTSLYFALLLFVYHRDVLSQTFSVTTAVVAPAVVICLNSLMSTSMRLMISRPLSCSKSSSEIVHLCGLQTIFGAENLRKSLRENVHYDRAKLKIRGTWWKIEFLHISSIVSLRYGKKRGGIFFFQIFIQNPLNNHFPSLSRK